MCWWEKSHDWIIQILRLLDERNQQNKLYLYLQPIEFGDGKAGGWVVGVFCYQNSKCLHLLNNHSLQLKPGNHGRSSFFLPQNKHGKGKWRIASSSWVTAVDGRRNEPRKGDLPIIYVEVESYDSLENFSWISSKEMKKRHKFHFDQVPSPTGSPATVPTKVPDRLLGGKSVAVESSNCNSNHNLIGWLPKGRFKNNFERTRRSKPWPGVKNPLTFWKGHVFTISKKGTTNCGGIKKSSELPLWFLYISLKFP